ncbi:fused acetyl/propionyl-CoA carboxylase subunit alpha/methylmalonyl-CoA decarboxylase subunit alpha, partial [Catenulispora sp. NF23]|uniref:biotin/lipoyl-containing protein n=1 Tax=Catenulispora pinistramenti TaxID=2705254 RepID=UPI0039B4F1A1|nr:fused acetyl/propionyl-CoA carboxylase subunit alpha/methylmalonyl-CoA decarboxylase subunit alpha [Catenulispora pinistramenti]
QDTVRTADVVLDRFDRHTGQIVVNGERFRLLTATHGSVHQVEVDGVTHRVSRDEGGVVRSPAPALVIATPVVVGDLVEAGAPVVVLESMKMETVLRAPFKARLRELAVTVGSQVETGAPLLRLEQIVEEEDGEDDTDTDTAQPSSEAVELDLPAAPAEVPIRARVTQGQEDLRSLLLGFDVDPHDEGRILQDYLTARTTAVEQGQRPLTGELSLIEVFADLAELAADRPVGGEYREADTHLHSAHEHFHTYLRSLDVERDGLPDTFRTMLAKVLARYGVGDLERTPELEAAVFRVFLAMRRSAQHAAVVAALLRGWLNDPLPPEAEREPVGPMLERLIAATQIRFPPVADLARGVVYAWFGQPLLRRNRARVYAAVRKNLRYLDATPQAEDRSERIAEMVRSTEPLVRLLGQRLVHPELDNSAMLEVLTRRYYGNKGLTGVQTTQAAGTSFVVAERDGSRLVSAAVPFDQLGDALAGLAGLAELEAAGGVLDADIYLLWENQPDTDEAATALQEVVSAHPLPERVRRVTTTVAGRRNEPMHRHFTFHHGAAGLTGLTGLAGLTENRLIRGLHPHIARRMQLERLTRFDLTRLPSTDEEVYLYRCVARENPADDRLVAFTQVRDLTELREPDGRLAALPTAEYTIAACLDSIRRARSLMPSGQRFTTNRVVVYVWPPVTLAYQELLGIANRVLATSVNLGLDEVTVIARYRDERTGDLVKTAAAVTFDGAGGAEITVGEPTTDPVEPLDDYRLKVLRAAGRGTVYPYEVTRSLGDFVEYDLGEDDFLVPVDRPRGANTAAVVVGVVSTATRQHPQGVTRVLLLGDPTKSLGALSEPECRRVIAALDLAERMQVPLE